RSGPGVPPSGPSTPVPRRVPGAAAGGGPGAMAGDKPATVAGGGLEAVAGDRPATVTGGGPGTVAGGGPGAMAGDRPATVAGGGLEAVAGGRPATVARGGPATGSQGGPGARAACTPAAVAHGGLGVAAGGVAGWTGAGSGLGVAAGSRAPAGSAPAAGPGAGLGGGAGCGGAARRGRIEGLLLGLAAGDAAGWPAARHRASRMPEWTRRLTRELDTFAERNATTTLPVPIALNQPPEPLLLGPSDDAEWAAFAAESVLTAAEGLLSDLSRSRRMRAAIDLAWNALASEIAAAADRAPEVESAVLPLRARISVRAGLGNLAAGLRPPATGHDNPHYFDDAACVRACVLAAVHPGDPAAAADLAEFDARYTQDGDGVHGARAMAAAVAAALAGADPDTAVEAALAQLPEATEIGRNARHAVKLARTHTEGGGAFAIVPTLEHEIVDHVYSYGIAAAETVPVALALATASRGRVIDAVPAAACLSRVADSAPALAGALTGALGGGDSVPAAWREACRILSGCALPRLAGTDLVELAALLARTELTSPKG
ncbi:ADP-ribosylglycohydrolase family protein, partial [Streptomyces sp. NPDC059650]|uniref:ADP-ribosylglycohydrolase family protein n=1 Tax=Streptomyces sp. NPDC059650 TaxID=3346896 RepID=UPI0036B8BB1B